MASEGLHKPSELMDEATIDGHRAITSVISEPDAAVALTRG
jgi:hypothetical protein